MNHRRQRESRVGRTSGDHHIRARRQGFRERECADIGIRAEDAIANARDRLSRIHIAKLVALREKFVQSRKDIVADHHGDLEPRRLLHHFARARQRIHTARIRDHLHTALANLFRNARDQGREVACIAKIRVGLPLLLQNRHRNLRQIVERQVVDRPLLYQANRRFQPVAPKSLTVCDSNHDVCPGLAVAASSSCVKTLRVSSGSMMASACPRAAAYRASSQRS